MTITAITEWAKLFPQKLSEDYSSSGRFIKQLTLVAISTITFKKDVFSKDSYITESFGGIKLNILKKKCQDGLANFLNSSLTDAFDAIDKKYLYQLALCFYEYECKPENLVECHTFEYTYKDDNVTMSIQYSNPNKLPTKYTFDNIREQTIGLIKSHLVSMESCQYTLPPSYGVAIRLYYHETTPEEYHAPGYITANDTDHLEVDSLKMFRVGSLNTPYHNLVVNSYLKTDRHEISRSSNRSILSDIVNKTGILGSNEKSTHGSDDDRLLVCPCNNYSTNDPYNSDELLTCCYCKTQQHAPCFGVPRKEALLWKQHCCALCHDADPSRPPTDTQMVPLSERRRASLSICRRTLEYCSSVETIRAQTIMDRLSLSQSNALSLLRSLGRFGVIRKEIEFDFKKPHRIIKDNLKRVIAKCFNMKEVSIVDQLVAEIEASQESLISDPVANILAPEQREKIHNSSILGRVIERPQDKPADDDPTLKQYREAVLPEENLSSFANARKRIVKTSMLSTRKPKTAKFD